MIHASIAASIQCYRHGEYRSFSVPAHGDPTFILPLLSHWISTGSPLTECYHQRIDEIHDSRPTMKEDSIPTRNACQEDWVYQIDFEAASMEIFCDSEVITKGLPSLVLDHGTFDAIKDCIEKVTFTAL